MTFSAMIRKNFLFHAKKYISLYFVNTLIVAILFMFGSLLYNPDILRQVGNTTLYSIVRMALTGVVLFSIVFVTYSNLSFLKYRGKELGMYITLGMTAKDLTRLLLLENLGIAAVSLCSGLITGAVFGKLFYMGLNQILLEHKLRFVLNAGSLLLSGGIFLIIACVNFAFNLIYIRKMSVARILQSAHVRETGVRSSGWGVLALVLFIVSVILLPGTLLHNWFDGNQVVAVICIVLTLICPYVMIGTGINLFKSVMKRFRRFYNHNLLVMSNLSHRLASYTTTLYIVTLLIAGALFFIGMTYSMYAATKETVQRNNPFDVLFVESGKANVMNEPEIAALLADNGDTVLSQNETLEYIALPEFRNFKGKWGMWDTQSMILAERAFNELLGTRYVLAEHQALFARVQLENLDFQVPDTILAAIQPEQAEAMPLDSGGKAELLQDLQGTVIQEYEAAGIAEVSEPYVNWVATASSYFGQALVVDDGVYERLKAAVTAVQIRKVHLLSGNISEAGFTALVDELRERNGYDASYWSTPYRHNLGAEDRMRAEQEAMRPVYRGELLSRELEANGTVFFITMFLGALFIIASGLVLYHKVLSDIDMQKESMASLKRIGVTPKEFQQLVSKELSILFMLPAVFGLGLGYYYFYIAFSNTGVLHGPLGRAAGVAAVFFLLQIAFCFASRRKYFSELGREL
ncbi:FtsX-like permease family protein [Paenibacillus sp. MMS20-IR301]|uniref:FtsX-like permease family protein n=1 Tax=Paenibacillus sp. MMS20-IR301 TaxID=2895946 RepID=UPI0028E56661|nr:FtsX-like permease family protein [Paenibacillus sp. MMS20-IR301]WNS43163.1 FtsX-like permease family protein [Paenibacillus sp. MMS20-IR301]